MKLALIPALAILTAALLFSGAASKQAEAYACNIRNYVNVEGKVVHSPTCRKQGRKWTAICRDGGYSYSRHARGTCSRHGGVRRWK